MTSHAARAQLDLSTGVSALFHRTAIVALLARRAIWMTALARVAPGALATLALASDEIAVVNRLTRNPGGTTTLVEALVRLATIGGGDGKSRRLAQPFVVARGLSRVADLQIAARLRAAKYRERT